MRRRWQDTRDRHHLLGDKMKDAAFGFELGIAPDPDIRLLHVRSNVLAVVLTCLLDHAAAGLRSTSCFWKAWLSIEKRYLLLGDMESSIPSSRVKLQVPSSSFVTNSSICEPPPPRKPTSTLNTSLMDVNSLSNPVMFVKFHMGPASFISN